MSVLRISTILVFGEHLLKGTVQTHGQRLLEVLKDEGSEFLSVYEAELFRRHFHAKSASFREVIVRKASIGLAIPATEKHEAPQRRIDAFVPKNDYSVFLVVLGYEIRGRMQLQGVGEPLQLVRLEMGRFIPVPDATISAAGSKWNSQLPQVVIVNRSDIALFEVTRPNQTAAVSPTDSLDG
jgi:hypothetical protein